MGLYCLLLPSQREEIIMMIICIREVVQWVTLNKYLVSRIYTS